MNIKLFLVFLLLMSSPLYVLGQQTVSIEKDKEHYTIYTSGLPFEDENARLIVGKKWRISYEHVANCMITPDMIPLMDSIDVLNDQTFANLSLEYGENWLENFRAEVAIEHQKLIAIQNTVECHPIIKQLKKTTVYSYQTDESDRFFDEEPTGSDETLNQQPSDTTSQIRTSPRPRGTIHPFFYFQPTKDPGKYLVHVYGHGNWGQAIKLLHFCVLKYSLTDYEITIVDQEVTLLDIEAMVDGE